MLLASSAVDRAVSACIEDLDQRGFSETILLVIIGEFGRAPKSNDRGGRDHWGNLCSLGFVGGGLPMSQVIDVSDQFGGSPTSDSVTSDHLLGTIMYTLFDIDEPEVGISRGILDVITTAHPIPQLS
ncbi:MAG: hypothetical protein M2R45_02831 [Verrucomicrobia subdivision 3 bacterium]|nr:hypothetical protein [Limisphaerales bacterium]MCS1415466.1 hypothetical protein [Limisphaerales bacterium]